MKYTRYASLCYLVSVMACLLMSYIAGLNRHTCASLLFMPWRAYCRRMCH